MTDRRRPDAAGVALADVRWSRGIRAPVSSVGTGPGRSYSGANGSLGSTWPTIVQWTRSLDFRIGTPGEKWKLDATR
jgi:hypothetical protein